MAMSSPETRGCFVVGDSSRRSIGCISLVAESTSVFRRSCSLPTKCQMDRPFSDHSIPCDIRRWCIWITRRFRTRCLILLGFLKTLDPTMGNSWADFVPPVYGKVWDIRGCKFRKFFFGRIVLYCIVVGSRRLMLPDALQPKAYFTNHGL